MLSGAGGAVEASLGFDIPAKAGIQRARQGTRGEVAGMGNAMLSGAGERSSARARITH